MMLQAGGAVPTSTIELLASSGDSTKVVLAITLLFSLISWFIIAVKWRQFRRLHADADRFFAELERAPRLQDAWQAVQQQKLTPHSRLLREAMGFYGDLRGAARPGEGPSRPGMTMMQLEALKMVLGKEVAAERDLLSHYVPWLATIGSVSPLLGLLGTVLGVMDAFVGIASKGSGNLAAVAPGVAEALITTVVGLAAAIPAVIAYNIFVNRVRVIGGELEGFASELIGTMAREGML